jgi:hypothetical protein
MTPRLVDSSEVVIQLIGESFSNHVNSGSISSPFLSAKLGAVRLLTARNAPVDDTGAP